MLTSGRGITSDGKLKIINTFSRSLPLAGRLLHPLGGSQLPKKPVPIKFYHHRMGKESKRSGNERASSFGLLLRTLLTGPLAFRFRSIKSYRWWPREEPVLTPWFENLLNPERNGAPSLLLPLRGLVYWWRVSACDPYRPSPP